MEQLTQEEIKRRMQEWRNLKVSNKKLAKVNKKLKAENKKLKEEVKILQEKLSKQELEIETLKILVAELQEIIFGKKKKKDEESDDDDEKDDNQTSTEKTPRSKESYRREIPNKEDVTETQEHAIDECPDCKGELKKKKIVIFYEEDIPLPTEDNKLKIVIEHKVEKGWCIKCKKWHSAIPIPPKKVVIGDSVKIYICYLSILMRLSFAQIQNILRDTFHFKISDGEIGNILQEMSVKWRAEFERIKERLRNGKGVHLDETSWGARWLWVMAGIDTEDVLYLAAISRGKGNAEELLGDFFHAVRVSDAYGAYKLLTGICQLCWAHPFRYLRTLKNTKTLKKTIKRHCIKAFEEFSAIYEYLRNCLKEDFEKEKRESQKQELIDRLNVFCKPHKNDPKKLKNVKQLCSDRMSEYLTCMDFEGIPCDNNKAERKLRHFVIKRKISFGNKSKKGAEAFEIAASVLMTYWKKFEENFFAKISQISAVV
jgi:hypothetical protein